MKTQLLKLCRTAIYSSPMLLELKPKLLELEPELLEPKPELLELKPELLELKPELLELNTMLLELEPSLLELKPKVLYRLRSLFANLAVVLENRFRTAGTISLLNIPKLPKQ